MGDLPLHPSIVHLPLVLAILAPLLSAGVLIAWWRGRLDARHWWFVTSLLAVLVVGGIGALNTGEREESRVEPFVDSSALESHEERAEVFIRCAAVSLMLSVLVPLAPMRLRRGLAVASLVASVVVGGLALRVGHSGGQLVYVHGAALAYATPDAPPMAPPGGPHETDHE